MAQNNFAQPIQQKHIVVLIATLILIPLLWGTGVFKIQAAYILPGLERPFFWTFFMSILFLEWLAFLLIFYATRPNMAEYLSINTAFLSKHKFLLIGGVIVLLILAGIAPAYLYSGELPSNSSTLGSIGPVSSIQRVAFIFLSLTAGICEEVIFRGYGISVLERIFKRKSVALIISSLAFMSLHGVAFLPWSMLVQYFIIGLIFGFIFQRYRRLEILIIVHFLLDALIAVSVP